MTIVVRGGGVGEDDRVQLDSGGLSQPAGQLDLRSTNFSTQ